MTTIKKRPPGGESGQGAKANYLTETHCTTPVQKMNSELPDNNADAALYWYEFGYKVVPIDTATKHPAVKWQPWLDMLSHETIEKHWQKNPNHEVGAIIDASFYILDADDAAARSALYILEDSFNIAPNLIVKTTKGEHHHFKKAAGTYAVMQSFSTKDEPHKLDVRTGRGETEGRSIIVLPPSTGKVIDVFEADNAADLVEVGQDFIDAVARHNGTEPPRPLEPQKRAELVRHSGKTEAAEILGYISPNVGYQNWFNVLAGLHDKFNGKSEGLFLADSWSEPGDTYPGFEEIEYKWNSFTTGKGITFATVADMAKHAGADLSAIARSYDENGNKRKTYSEIMDEAKLLTNESEPAAIDAVIKESAALAPVEKRRVRNEIKANTSIPLSVMEEADRSDHESDDLDDLQLARSLVDEIGSENVIAADSFVWQWRKTGVWQSQEDRAVKQWVQHHLAVHADVVRKSLVDSVADLFKTEIFRSHHVFNIGQPECVNTLNGELALNEGKWELLPHNRQHYRTTQSPVLYDPSAEAPRFIQFLNEVFMGDADGYDKGMALMEMVGYSLMAHCRHERFIILVGTGANGKSVLLKVLEALLGAENVAGVQPSQFGNSFQRAHLHGKLANIVTEVKEGEVIDDASLKGIVSGEPTTVEHKFKDPFVMRPFSTCWFGTNHMPHTRDFSDALFRRALVMEFNNKFKPELGNCDPQLGEKLQQELPGILNIALNAYALALKKGFTMPESCRQARDKWRLEADQVAQFIEDSCTVDPNGKVPPKALFEAYRNWANESGIRNQVSFRTFGERLKALGYEQGRTGADGRFYKLNCKTASIFETEE